MQLSEHLKNYKVEKSNRADIALVDEIFRVIGKQSYPKWIGRLHKSKLSPTQIISLVDKADKMDVKYRAGYIWKRLI